MRRSSVFTFVFHADSWLALARLGARPRPIRSKPDISWTVRNTSPMEPDFDSLDPLIRAEAVDGGQAGFWDIDERYVRLSEVGDPLEKLEPTTNILYM